MSLIKRAVTALVTLSSRPRRPLALASSVSQASWISLNLSFAVCLILALSATNFAFKSLISNTNLSFYFYSLSFVILSSYIRTAFAKFSARCTSFFSTRRLMHILWCLYISLDITACRSWSVSLRLPPYRLVTGLRNGSSCVIRSSLVGRTFSGSRSGKPGSSRFLNLAEFAYPPILIGLPGGESSLPLSPTPSLIEESAFTLEFTLDASLIDSFNPVLRASVPYSFMSALMTSIVNKVCSLRRAWKVSMSCMTYPLLYCSYAPPGPPFSTNSS